MSKKYMLVLVIVLAVFGAMLYKYGRNSDNSESTSPTPEASASTSPAAGGSGTGQTSRVFGENISYSDAVKKYADRRIQFDAYCQGLPKNPVFKNNTSVMFDNRSGDARWITLDGVRYNFPGYGFKIITLSSAKLPHTVNVDCGSAQNVMTILLQK